MFQQGEAALAGEEQGKASSLSQAAVPACGSSHPGPVPSSGEGQESRATHLSLFKCLGFFCNCHIAITGGMSPSRSDTPESCGSGSRMRRVTRPCCHPDSGVMPQLQVMGDGESMAPSGTGGGTGTAEPVPAQLSARAGGCGRSNPRPWEDKPRAEVCPRTNPALVCLHRADARRGAVSSVRAICSRGGKKKLFS